MAHTLDLTTTDPQRSHLTIDGTTYELAAAGDLSMLEERRALRVLDRVQKFLEMDDDEVSALEHDLRTLTGSLVRNCDDDVLAKLSDAQRIQVVTAFFGAATTATDPPDKTRKKSTRSSKSSRTSKGSTAAARRSGSR